MYKLIDLKKYTSIGIGPSLNIKVIDKINSYDEYKIIGKGNNLLVSNNPPKLAVLGKEFDYIHKKENKLYVGAATSSGKLLTFCKKNNIADFEFLAKLPGNLGGLTKMNAGLKEWEIFNYIEWVKTSNGVFLKKDIPYAYRNSNLDGIIYEIVFNIKKGFDLNKQKMFIKMRDNQPHGKSAGSCFKNPSNYSAGYLIEQVGLKGYSIGDMQFSSIHANFLINKNNGTFNDAISLIELAKKKVFGQFGIKLKEEIIIL